MNRARAALRRRGHPAVGAGVLLAALALGASARGESARRVVLVVPEAPGAVATEALARVRGETRGGAVRGRDGGRRQRRRPTRHGRARASQGRRARGVRDLLRLGRRRDLGERQRHRADGRADAAALPPPPRSDARRCWRSRRSTCSRPRWRRSGSRVQRRRRAEPAPTARAARAARASRSPAAGAGRAAGRADRGRPARGAGGGRTAGGTRAGRGTSRAPRAGGRPGGGRGVDWRRERQHLGAAARGFGFLGARRGPGDRDRLRLVDRADASRGFGAGHVRARARRAGGAPAIRPPLRDDGQPERRCRPSLRRRLGSDGLSGRGPLGAPVVGGRRGRGRRGRAGLRFTISVDARVLVSATSTEVRVDGEDVLRAGRPLFSISGSLGVRL